MDTRYKVRTSGGNAYLRLISFLKRVKKGVPSGSTYHDQNAIIKPNQEKVKTRPYTLMGLKAGMERAFRLTGLTSGAFQRVAGLNMLSWRA